VSFAKRQGRRILGGSSLSGVANDEEYDLSYQSDWSLNYCASTSGYYSVMESVTNYHNRYSSESISSARSE
jgi:hypothetical protein